MDFESNWTTALGILLYSGAVLPLGLALWLARCIPERYQRNRRLLLVLLAVQVVSFLPFVISCVRQDADAIHALSLPALVGVIQFLFGVVRLVQELRYRSKEKAAQSADHVISH